MYRLVAAVVVLAVCHVAALKAGSQPPQPAAGPAPKRVDHLGDPLPDGAVARLGTTRYRHRGMDLLGFTADGKSLMFLGSGTIRFMDLATGMEGKVITFGETQPRGFRGFDMGSSMVLSHDTKVLATCSMQPTGMSTITVIDLATGKERKRFESAELFKNGGGFFQPEMSLTADGKWLLVCSGRNGNALPLIWVDTESGQVVHDATPEKGQRFGFAQFSRDGRHIVALEHGEMGMGMIKGNANPNANMRLRVIDAARGISLRSLEVPANALLASFELCPDGKTLLAFNAQGGPVRLFDYSEGKELKEVRAFSALSAQGSFALAPDGKQLFILGSNKVHHWDVETGKEIRQIDVAGMQRNDMNFGNPFGRSGPARSLAISQDGKQMAFSGANSVQVFDAATGKQLVGGSASAAISTVLFTPDGKGLVVSTTDFAIKMWDPRTAKEARTFARFEGNGGLRQRGMDFFSMFTDQAAFSADGKLLGVRNGEGGMGIWNVGTGAAVKWYGAEQQKNPQFDLGSNPQAFAFAPRGDMLATSQGGGGIKLWDVANGKGLRTWTWNATPAQANMGDDSAMVCLAFSPDGRTLAGGGVDGVRDGMPRTTLILWEAVTGKERLRIVINTKGMMGNGIFELDLIFLGLAQMPLSLSFSPDGKHLMMGTLNGFHLLDAATGKDVVSFTGRMLLGRTAIFSADGKLLFVGKGDGMVRILDVSSGKVVRDLAAHEDPVHALSISPDGKMLASGSTDSTVLLWDIAELTRPQDAAKPATAKELDKLWNDLADGDAAKAFQAITALASVPAEAVPLIKSRLKAVPPVDPKVLTKLFDDLNSQKFAVREKANFDLEKLGDLAGPMLKEQLAANPSLEMRQRMEKLLAKLNGHVQSADTLQALRHRGTGADRHARGVGRFDRFGQGRAGPSHNRGCARNRGTDGAAGEGEVISRYQTSEW